MTHRLFAKAVAAGLLVMVAGTVRAQDADPDAAAKMAALRPVTMTKALTEALNQPQAIAERTPLSSDWQASPFTRTASHSRSSIWRKVGYGFAGGFVGMLAGAGIGSTLTQNCRCHDPGYGGLIGMPIGAAVGATFFVWLADR
jgi:hypothetical protein